MRTILKFCVLACLILTLASTAALAGDWEVISEGQFTEYVRDKGISGVPDRQNGPVAEWDAPDGTLTIKTRRHSDGSHSYYVQHHK